MDANDFITKIKASGAAGDKYDITETFEEYHDILIKLSSKDKASFSLNVLCILCRNLDKVPKWRDSIDNKELLKLSIQCVRQTRILEGPDRVKTLACIYHIHKHIVRQNSSIPPELILKLSFMPFECDDLLKEYCKTYWSILVDRLTYIEKLKLLKMPILKLLSKLTEDIIKTINIYDSVLFCTTLLQFLIKKMHFLFNDWAKELNVAYGDIFYAISKKDLKKFKNLTEKQCLDLYVKINDMIFVIMDNSLKNDFKCSAMENFMKLCLNLLGHNPDMFHCFQTFYVNSFCCILKDRTNSSLIENVLNNLLVSFEITEKLGYRNILYLTYPYLSQLFRLFLDKIMNGETKELLTASVQESCLKLIKFLIDKLKKTNQLLNCENCTAKSGQHDALRLSFLIKNFIIISADNKIDIKINMSMFYEIVQEQYIILKELKSLGCPNYEKCFRKLQTDVHNVAISLNKTQIYEYSIQLFEIYLKNELGNIKSDADLKNISRALYNKSICELDFKLYENSLRNAFLSLIFALPESMSSEKFLSLVMDVKAKALKNDENNDIQMMSVMTVCESLYNDCLYGNLKPYIGNLEFCCLLKHEFSMYTKLWPSIVPIAGVWTSLYDLLTNKHTWVKAENEDIILWTLYGVMLQTPLYVRTVHNENYKDIVNKLLRRIEEGSTHSTLEKLVYSTLLLLKSEYDITDASVKYGWKVAEQIDPEQIQITRTIEQEHNALAEAFKAVDIMRELVPHLKSEKSPLLSYSLQICQVFVQQFLFMHRYMHALHLAGICCDIADICDDKEAYIRNATVLTSFMTKNGEFNEIMTRAMTYCKELMKNVDILDVILNFVCEVAMYHAKCGKVSVSAGLVQMVQVKLLQISQDKPDLNVSLSTGSLMRAQFMLRPDSGLSFLSALNGIQRHYLAFTSNSSRWVYRRISTLYALYNAGVATLRAVCGARGLRAWRRAVAAAAPRARLAAFNAAEAAARALHSAALDHAQVTIENRLKYVLGIHPNADTTHTNTQKHDHYTPKHTNLETMRDSMVKKNQTSPSFPCTTVPRFDAPEFMGHVECVCRSCNPPCLILTCFTFYLESSMYYRAKECDIAKDYFIGTLNMFEETRIRLKDMFKYGNLVGNVLESWYKNVFMEVYMEFLLEYACFELSQGEFEKADEFIIRIHDLIAECDIIDDYLRNDVLNIMVTSARMRSAKKSKETGLEIEMESLKLTPTKETEIPKTPETKILPKIETIKIVKDEEIPKKRKVIKLNLDETSSEETEKPVRPIKPKFKIPVPVTTKPVLETITPRRTRSKPDITVQKPSIEEPDFNIFTPKSEKSAFFTPCQNTPAEQFFTPMTSLKTYSKRIVKNLESEFSTPKLEKNETKNIRKVETGSVKTMKDKRTLKRSTSPGKLVDEKPVARPRRIRQPVLNDK